MSVRSRSNTATLVLLGGLRFVAWRQVLLGVVIHWNAVGVLSPEALLAFLLNFVKKGWSKK